MNCEISQLIMLVLPNKMISDPVVSNFCSAVSNDPDQ